MDLVELFKARQIWYELIQSDEAKNLDWTGWIDKALLSVIVTPPYWLCEAALADKFEDFAQLIEADIGLDREFFIGNALDEEALAFGLAYHLFEDEPCQAIWRQLCEVGDPAEFIESGRWIKYQPDQGKDISKLSEEDLTFVVFHPVCEYTLKSIEAILGKAIVDRLTPHSTRTG